LRAFFKFRRWAEAFQTASRIFEGRVHHGHLAPSDLMKSRRLPLLVFNALFALLLAWVLVSPAPNTRPLPFLRSGDVADQMVVSPLTTEVQPKDSLSKSRAEAQQKTPPVFDFDESVTTLWLQKWQTAFARVRQLFFSDTMPSGAPASSPLQLADRIAEVIRKETGQQLLTSDLLFLIQSRFSTESQGVFEEMAKPLLGRMVSDMDLFPLYYGTGIFVRQISLGLNESLVNDVSRIWSLEHARGLIGQILASHPKRSEIAYQRVARILQSVLVPNLVLNAGLTEKRIHAALSKKDLGIITVRRGQTILRMGDRITEEQNDLVDTLRELTSLGSLLKRFVVTTLLLFLFLHVLFYFDLTRRSFLRLSLKNSLVFAATAAGSLLGMKLAHPMLQILLDSAGVPFGAEFVMPVAAGAVLVHLLLGRELSFSFAVLLAICSGLLMDRSLTYGVWVFIVCSVAIQSLGACKQRTDLYKCGAWSGAVGALLLLSTYLGQSTVLDFYGWSSALIHCVSAFVAGMLGSIIASTLIPLLEAVLGYTTNLKLLELANFNHPLLHNLMMKAPGTYHHSVMVGSLAEIAADKIKANGLLARVSAYYHDIGKMNNPLYFIENQSPQYNPHDHLSPSISARILFSHVKNGTRMGREHNLGDPIVDIIEQHHGTTLATYFFDRAKDMEKGKDACTNDSDYRYPGPRPQTREAAIVMIADACEASTRSIADPTATKIQGMVHTIINKRFLDQQFHDCDLTMKDLKVIEECISKTLLSLYHHRIEYPGQKDALEKQSPAQA
jgi:cyclic-di-AMP phosphodiesterase PgpH